MSCFNPPYCPKIKFFHEQSNDIFLIPPQYPQILFLPEYSIHFSSNQKALQHISVLLLHRFHLCRQNGLCVCHYLLPVTLCFVQLLYKCIFKSCKRRNKAVAYQQNQFIYFLLIIYMNRGVALF